MSSEIRSFNFNALKIRAFFDADGNPRFVASDCCKALGLANGREVITGFPCDEKGVADVYTPGGTQQMTVITEPGLYRLIFVSRRPEAESFRRWVTHEVLPEIRKTGAYGSVETLIPKTLPEALRAYAIALEAQEALHIQTRAQRATIAVLEPKAAFHDAVAVAVNTQSISAVAKVLGTGQNRLFEWLRDQKILMDDNRPYQEYLERGYFQVIEQKFEDSKGRTRIATKTLVTGKGLAWIQRRFAEEGAA